MVSGTLSQARVYQRKDGEQGINLDVNSDHVDFVVLPPQNNGGFQQQQAPQANQQSYQAPQQPQGQFNQQQFNNSNLPY
jgi:hypothetical protein